MKRIRRQRPIPEPPVKTAKARDRISDLPDAILGDIISLLPCDEGARAQLLNRRWRHLWRSAAPLNLDCRRLPGDLEAQASALSRVLSSHPGPCRRLCVCADLFRRVHDAAWLRSAALRNLQELDYFFFNLNYSPPPRAPISRFSPTLRVVRISCCDLSDGNVLQGLGFPSLKELQLHLVTISEHSLHNVILGCPALDCLKIFGGYGFRCVRINSLGLRSIEVRTSRMISDGKKLQFEELVVEDAPCLESLFQVGRSDDILISVISAPKLEALSFRLRQGSSTRISFGSMVIQGFQVDNPAMVVHTIRILVVDMDPPSLDTVIYLMKCFPCLEKLYIKLFSSKGPNNYWRHKHQNLTRCLDIPLKTIVLENYRGITKQVNFVTFFVLNARRLESMTLGIRSDDNTEEFRAEQYMKLQLDDRVSRDARFNFTTDCCFPYCWGI